MCRIASSLPPAEAAAVKLDPIAARVQAAPAERAAAYSAVAAALVWDVERRLAVGRAARKEAAAPAASVALPQVVTGAVPVPTEVAE
jgi:hypothetical protein